MLILGRLGYTIGRLGPSSIGGLGLIWTPEAYLEEDAADTTLIGTISLPAGVTGTPTYALDSGSLVALDTGTGEITKDGTWIGEGPIAVTVSVSGVTPALPPLSFYVQVKPVALEIDLQALSDSGEDDTDNITNATTWIFDVTAPGGALAEGETVRLRDGANVLATKIVDAADVLAESLSFGSITVSDGAKSITIDRIRGSAQSDNSNAISLTLDTIAPVLSSATGTKTGSSTANLSVATTETTGTLYVFVSTSATPPSAATLRAGTGAAFAANDTSPTNPTTFSATGLSSNTTYYAHYLHDDAAGNASSIATSSSFTTDVASYTAQGVVFDGTNDYLTSGGANLASAADSKIALVSFWFWMRGGNAAQQILFFFASAGSTRFGVIRETDNTIRVLARNAAGTTILDVRTTTTYTDAMSGWAHCAVAVDLNTATQKAQIYVDGVSRAGSPSTLTDDTMELNIATTPDFRVGNNAAGTSILNAYLAELYINTAEVLDLSSAPNIAKFASGGHPVSLGADGSLPTGNVPIVYLANPTATWQNNLGYGGNLTEVGALTDAPSAP